MRRKIFFATLAVISALILTIHCGGGGKSTGPKTKGDGRVRLRNETQAKVTTSYYNEQLNKEIQVPNIASNTTADISQEVLKGGSKVKFHVATDRSPDDPHGWQHLKVEADIEVTIDGDVTIIVKPPVVFGAPLNYTIA